jgi:uncharacterized protein involved in exopolysaccharide biosynthesis
LSDRDENQDGEGGGGRAGLPVDPLRLWLALRKRWQLVAVITIVGAFIGAAVAKKVVKQSFEATAVLAWESSMPVDLVTRQTTLESVALTKNLEHVRTKMGLAMPVRELGNFFIVTSNTNSNLVNIKAVWASADGAANMANLLTRAFLHNRERASTERLHEDVQRRRAVAEEAERRSLSAARAFETFRRDNGILDFTEEREQAIQATADAAAAAEEARRKAEEAQAALDALSAVKPGASAPIEEPSEAEHAEAEADIKRLSALSSELAAARVQFSDEHINVIRLAAERDAVEARVQKRGGKLARGMSEARRRKMLEQKAREAAAQRERAEEAAARLEEKRNKLSELEDDAALLLGSVSVAEKILEAAKQQLAASEAAARRPPREFRILEEATPPEYAMSSPRKKVAIVFPAGFFALGLFGVILGALRRGDVVTPREAAFWAAVPVVGASTWPNDAHMLASLMHDLDDFAPRCEGVTLIVGLSLDEASLARQVADWQQHGEDEPHDAARLLTAGGDGRALAPRSEAAAGLSASSPQILTLTGSVPAQALRRAARMADRVLVVALSGRHGWLELTRVRNLLGRDAGVGILLVGLPKPYAMVRDRVGEVARFWRATREAAAGRAQA